MVWVFPTESVVTIVDLERLSTILEVSKTIHKRFCFDPFNVFYVKSLLLCFIFTVCVKIDIKILITLN